MKRKHLPSKSKGSKHDAAAEKQRIIIRQATRRTLEQFAKTFKDLARYDRTDEVPR